LEIRVPSNLLLAGEYAVTLEGGQGIAFALEPYVHCSIAPARSLSISGYNGIESFTRENSILIKSTIEVFTEQFGSLPSVELHIDSRQLSLKGIRKLGLGSSAATAVALSSALLYSLDQSQDPASIFPLALEAHRRFQGGGSGYDIAASCYGGWIHFIGGELPQVHQIPALFSENMALLAGRKEVKSISSVKKFLNWLADERNFLSENNHFIETILHASSKQGSLSALSDYADFARKLGRDIGVDADIPIELIDQNYFLCKSLGAGNELALLFSKTPPESAISVSEGIQWLI
jgi:phosphomevalonate kinase